MNKEEFVEEISKLNIHLSEKQLQDLDTYYHLLIEWNEKINLTAITKEEDVYLKHFYDSLTLNKIISLNNQSICDIGTGAGFPGIVLKIAFPNLQITLVESLQKRCIFLKEVIHTLKLENIEIIPERAEIYSKKVREKYDIITSRAVANIKILLEYSSPLAKINGYIIPMKGNACELEDISSYLKKFYLKEIKKISFQLPKEHSERTLACYQKIQKTPKIYPRNYNQIKKELEK